MAVSLHFKYTGMIELVGIHRILKDSADRLDPVYIVELEAIGPAEDQLWTAPGYTL
jgi:hypothetical protein